MLVRDWCSSCGGADRHTTRGGYRFHSENEGIVLLESGRDYAPGFAIWYPYGNEPAPVDVGTVHIAGGWSSDQIFYLLKWAPDLCWLEFAPSQRHKIGDDGWLKVLYDQPGGAVGLRLKSCTKRH